MSSEKPLRLWVNDLDRSSEQPAMRKGTLVGNSRIPYTTTPGAIWLASYSRVNP
jgi:hypothetical protein